MPASREPKDPLLRLSRAVDAFLSHREQNGETREAFLGRHEDLRDLFEPMFEEKRAGDAAVRVLVPPFGDLARPWRDAGLEQIGPPDAHRTRGPAQRQVLG